ncbi:hypothetical protein QQF64_028123 [Cirrhinus molitorella]|uniref:Uncharacterized protein n=1 Tax=Cirrhinus molitorella TaxID=172907 RepID=A0ABR3N5V1_9TELE
MSHLKSFSSISPSFPSRSHRQRSPDISHGGASRGERERERARERERERERRANSQAQAALHAFSLAERAMDVRFYPAPPSSVGSCTLPTDTSLSSLDYYHSNKVIYPTMRWLLLLLYAPVQFLFP